jgi:hypothetical protein
MLVKSVCSQLQEYGHQCNTSYKFIHFLTVNTQFIPNLFEAVEFIEILLVRVLLTI